jgi:hypothetical protein
MRVVLPSKPAGVRQHTVVAEMVVDVRFPTVRLLFSTAHDEGETLQKQEILCPATVGKKLRAHIFDVKFCDFGLRRNYKQNFGMERREIPTGVGRALR